MRDSENDLHDPDREESIHSVDYPSEHLTEVWSKDWRAVVTGGPPSLVQDVVGTKADDPFNRLTFRRFFYIKSA